MPNCKEVARLIASEELADLGWSQRALVRIHLLRCRDCRRYAAELRAIGAAALDRWDTRPADKQALEKLESSILKRCLDASDANIGDRRGHDPEPPATQETYPH
jgi:hypothetical protein